MSFMRPRFALIALFVVLPLGGCSWANKKVGYVMSGESMSDKKPLPGLTEAKAKERIAALVKDSLQDMPDGFFYASYAPNLQPGQGGFTEGASVPVFGDDAPDQIYTYSVSYWAHLPNGPLSVENWFDKAASYWSSHAEAVKTKKVYPRDESFITQDGYSIGLTVNVNHDFAIRCTSSYYSKDTTGKNSGDYMPESITRNGYSPAGEPRSEASRAAARVGPKRPGLTSNMRSG